MATRPQRRLRSLCQWSVAPSRRSLDPADTPLPRLAAYSSTDWILGWLHRATAGGLSSVAGLHPVTAIADIDNVDLTHIVPGHLAYRALMPLVLGELGFRTNADYFDEPEDLSKIPEREIVLEPTHFAEEAQPTGNKFTSFFKRKKDGSSTPTTPNTNGSRTPNPAVSGSKARTSYEYDYDEDADDVEEKPRPATPPEKTGTATPPPAAVNSAPAPAESERESSSAVTFDTDQILAELRLAGVEVKELPSSLPPLAAPSPSTKPALAPASPARAPMPAAPARPAPPTRDHSSLSNVHSAVQLPGTASGMSSSTTVETVRDRTLGKSLPPIDPEASAAWGNPQPPQSDRAPANRGWEPPEMSFGGPPSPVDHLGYGAPGNGISLTFASFDDDDDDISSANHTASRVSNNLNGVPHASSTSAPKPPPQLSFGGADGAISYGDDNPWG